MHRPPSRGLCAPNSTALLPSGDFTWRRPVLHEPPDSAPMPHPGRGLPRTPQTTARRAPLYWTDLKQASASASTTERISSSDRISSSSGPVRSAIRFMS